MRLSTRIKVLALVFSNAAAAIMIGLFVMAAPTPAMAGTTIDDAVILDPYDPTPGIGFGCDDGCGYRHCYSGCARPCYSGCRRGGCYDGCRRYRGCEDGCRSSYRCEHDCNQRGCEHDCYVDRDRCHDGGCRRDDNCGSDCDGSRTAVPCTSDHCYNAERWEHRWRDGDRSGHEWYRAGSNQRDKSDDHQWDDGHDSDWDDTPPPPPPPPPPVDDEHHHHH